MEAFLSHLATERHVAASTQNQALAAMLFLYKEVLGIQLPWLDHVIRAKQLSHLPVVLTMEEMRAILARLVGRNALMAEWLYGAGLRLMECLRLRVKDMDFAMRQITVHDGKGFKDRVILLTATFMEPLRRLPDKKGV